MNKQSNLYTIIYIVALVVVVGAGLAYTAMSLRDKQQANADADRQAQILASVGLVDMSKGYDKAAIKADFEKYITEQLVVDSQGRVVGHDAFSIDVATQAGKADSVRQLPVYVCAPAPGQVRYIMPMYGSGLWGPIWGYMAVDSDGSTVCGAYFGHQGETPGLGAEITTDGFRCQFVGKRLIKDDAFYPIEVVKANQPPMSGADYVDAVSGGTITSKSVAAMIDNCIKPYEAFLRTLQNKQ